jgi:apolipoprotein N-acyltransferase
MTTSQPLSVEIENRRSSLLLVLGAVLIFMTFMRFSIAEVAWVTFAPFLIFLHTGATGKRHGIVLGVLLVAFIATISKMATAEIPWLPPVPMFAIPIALSYFGALSLSAFAQRRLGARAGVYTFAAAATALGWLQYAFTPGSSWGVLAHTQLNNLPLLQLVSLTGIGGVTFLVALGSSLAAAAWTRGFPEIRRDFLAFAVALAATLLWGELRLGSPAPGLFVCVGSVISPVTHEDFHAARQDVDILRHYDDHLFNLSWDAVQLGAEVVVWDEMATIVSVANEATLTDRAQKFAQNKKVMLMIAYGVVSSTKPLRLANKYRIYLPDGTLADEYLKRHPVPGDPDDVGQAHARVIEFEGVKYTGAICYDYGFPAIARDNAADGADLVLVPASDWRGIDPEHGRMALMNAVSVGLPMVRPVRAATTIVSDQFGRLRGTMRSDGEEHDVLVTTVPAARVPTLYSKTGEVLPPLCLLFCALVIVQAARSKRAD